MTPIPVILGPTASGKTSVGIALAKLSDGEIISVDSRKVYTGLSIGTATPKGHWENEAYQVQGVPHHLMDFLSPDRFYTAGDFAKDADQLIGKILDRKKTPILVGGTGFYFKALQKGLPKLPPRNEKFRNDLDEKIKKNGIETLHSELKTRDPVAAAAISSKDRHKIIRALEVIEGTGEPFSKWKSTPRNPSSHSFLVLGLEYAKELLDQRIKERSQKMVEGGMIEEAASLLKKGFNPSCPALSSFGYKEAVQVIEGKLNRDQFLSALIKGTVAYAKRQRTWFRTQIQPTWFKINPNTQKQEIALKMKDFLQSTL